jgi:tryptophanyl-tRNA synthetase
LAFVLPGFQPTGELHIGHYFGAIQNNVDWQNTEDARAFFLIADYHALTKATGTASKLVEHVRHVAAMYLSAGLDAQRAILYRQSDVPEVCELAWILSTVTPMGLLERAVAYKDTRARSQSCDAGVFNYPVLMAADILLVSAEKVTVGRDQLQHVEICRDIARRFNQRYGEQFVITEAELGKHPYVPGTNREKMSKHYDNTICILDEGDVLRDRVKGIATDSKPLDAPKNPDTCTVFQLYALMATPEEQHELAERYRGGVRYDVAKQLLEQRISEYFADMRQSYRRHIADPGYVDDLLASGAARVRDLAREKLDGVRSACGLGSFQMPKARFLTYAEYINDFAIAEALRIPQPPPDGQTEKTWPMWHLPDSEGSGVAWSPGDSWPRVPNWCHEEVLFIRVHQAFEVWFSVVLHEIGAVVQRATDLCAVEGTDLQRIDLNTRVGMPPEFSPMRFPKLRTVVHSFKQPYLQYPRIPSPGYYSVAGAGLAGVEPSDLYEWTALIRRAAAAMAVTVPFFDVLRTMTPHQFLQFRGRLAPASGFGSTQFREIEMLLGLRESAEKRLRPDGGTSEEEPDAKPIPSPMVRPTKLTPPDQRTLAYYSHHRPEDWARLVKRFRAPSLRDVVYNLLNTNLLRARGVEEADEAMDDFASHIIEETIRPFDRPGVDESFAGALFDEMGQVLAHRETITAARLSTESDDDEKREACLEFLNACLDLDAALLRWRDTHIRFVESMIGKRPGTGGGGVNYLRSTTDSGLAAFLTHAFPCLWQARSIVRNAG